MADAPRFTPLPPPVGGSADARRRGLLRRRRRQGAAAAALLTLTGAVLSAAAVTSSTAIDRLEPAPVATAPAGPSGEASAGPSPQPAPEPTAVTGSPDPAPAPTPDGDVQPADSPRPEAAAPQRTPEARPPQPQGPGPAAGPVLTRVYDPPTGGDTTVCTGRISSGIGPPRAETGWCVLAQVDQRPGARADLTVEVCRSSEAATADLHVDRGAVAMRVEQEGRVAWRLPLPDEPSAVLRVEPGGCWRWTYAWVVDGLRPGAAVLYGASLSDEVRDFEGQQRFTYAP